MKVSFMERRELLQMAALTVVAPALVSCQALAARPPTVDPPEPGSVTDKQIKAWGALLRARASQLPTAKAFSLPLWAEPIANRPKRPGRRCVDPPELTTLCDAARRLLLADQTLLLQVGRGLWDDSRPRGRVGYTQTATLWAEIEENWSRGRLVTPWFRVDCMDLDANSLAMIMVSCDALAPAMEGIRAPGVCLYAPIEFWCRRDGWNLEFLYWLDWAVRP
jgi:hypothetical protein